jgi:hypothetical protein
VIRRTTIQRQPRSDLSQRVENYYRQLFEEEDRGAAFAQWMDAIREDVLETGQDGADPAFILHVLVCTWDRRIHRHADDIEATRRLTARQKALLVGALRLLRRLGEPWLTELLGPPEAGRGRRFLTEALELETALTGAVVRTPAWQSGAHARGKPRAEENAVTACIVCLLEELKQHPKAPAAVSNLLEKAGLLRRSRGGAAGEKFVAKRAERARLKAKDRLGPIGNIVFLLRCSYTELREWLLEIPDIPDTATIWEERARAWGTSAAQFRSAFHGYCRARGWRGHTETLSRFENELSDVRKREGAAPLARVLANLAGETFR